jgi:hypothetical protein
MTLQNTVKTKLTAILVAAVVGAFATPVSAQQVAGIFGKGRTHFFVTGGPGYTFDENYFVFGAGASYYLVDGLSAGLSLEWWSGGDPGITKITPALQYVFYQVPVAKPYVGVFYRRTIIESLPDLDSWGARAGAFFAVGRNASIGVGGVYESYFDCSNSVYRKCDSTYPELSFTIAF